MSDPTVTTSARGMRVHLGSLGAASRRLEAAHEELAAAWGEMPALVRDRLGTVTQTLLPDGSSQVERVEPGLPLPAGFRQG